MNYISNTLSEKQKMLKTIGVKAVEDLFSAIPDEVLYKEDLDLPQGISELELKQTIKKIAGRNTSLDEVNSFLGAGAYDHYIPAIIDHIISRSEYYTAYTPYQAELSQGSLQSIYEYQSMICELTAMEVANASLLDGGSAAGEAVLMAARANRKQKILVSRSVHPSYRQVINTYARNQNLKCVQLNINNTITDLEDFEKKMNDEVAAVVVQYPNFFGSIEELGKLKEIIGNNHTLFIVIANPISLGILKPPGMFSADIVLGEGQPLGNRINYGGPYLGYMATCKKYLRQMPGRIVGATSDIEGNRGYVMTLQTREQHIRRGRATSNICTNEALNALIATIYMAVMGKQGIYEVAKQCLQKTHYLADKINELKGYKVLNKNSFFNEFLLSTPHGAKETRKRLQRKGILAGIDISRFDYEHDNLLVCVTEKKSKEELDSYISALEVLANE